MKRMFPLVLLGTSIFWLCVIGSAFGLPTPTATPTPPPIVVPANKLAWDQSAPDAAAAQSYTYRYYADGASTGTVLNGETCAGTSTIVCQAQFPPFSPGQHTVRLTASSEAGESDKSAPLSFITVVVPAVPSTLRIQ